MQELTPEILSCLSPFSALGTDSLRQVLSLACVEEFPRGSQALDFHWEGRVAYLLKGELRVDYPGGLIKLLVGRHVDAALPLGRRGAPPVSIRPITDICLVWFDETALDILLTWDQLVPTTSAGTADADKAADWRAMNGIFDARELTLGTFSCLPAAHIDSLLTCFKRQRVVAGEVIVRQGGVGDYYYVIERGRAAVSREVAGAHMELAEIKAGDAFGEEALIAETCRNATVTMKTDGELLQLAGADFVRLLREPLLQGLEGHEAVQRVKTAGAVWLDVRFSVEYRNDGLPGAMNIPLNELRDALPNLNRDVEYIAYCQTGRRSSAAAFLLSQRGFRASLLVGGLRALTSMEKTVA